jgi:hypothetical protein
MPEREERCQVCGSVLQRGQFGLICKKCNKEFYYNEKNPAPKGGETGLKCSACSWNLVQSPYNPKLYVCSNGNCPSRDENDTPRSLDEIKNVASSLQSIDKIVKNSIQKHVGRGGTPPRTWEEAREIVIKEYPLVAPLFIVPKPKKSGKKSDFLLSIFIEDLLMKGWTEDKILKLLMTRKMGKLGGKDGQTALSRKDKIDVEDAKRSAKERSAEAGNLKFRISQPIVKITHALKNDAKTRLARKSQELLEKWRIAEARIENVISLMKNILNSPEMYEPAQIKMANDFLSLFEAKKEGSEDYRSV